MLKILHLEDIPTDAELVSIELSRAGILFEKLVVDTKPDYKKAIDKFLPDIILSDHSLPSFNSLEALSILKESGLNIPFILVTATVSEEFAVNVMKEGATDYILKDRMQRLPNAVLNSIERKNEELEREKITAELMRRNRDLEQFTYIISHNLRSHVANIKGLSNLLNCFEYEDEECTGTLAALSHSVNSLDKVIIDLNQILQTGNQVNDKNEWVSLPLICEEISSELQSIISINNASINCDFSSVSDLFILKSYLYSVFQNLIVNSIKYRKVETDPVINITSELTGDKAAIYFTDNGKGIDLAKNGAQLFGLYKRFDHSVEGKGMGLFMVKMQVESIGGAISVESEPGKGTKFKIEFLVKKGEKSVRSAVC